MQKNKNLDKGMVKSSALTYAFVGDGKGKTSAALGVTLRMLLLGKRVVWISWFKSKDWSISEMKLESVFNSSLKMHWGGKGFYFKNGTTVEGDYKKEVVADSVVYDFESPQEHKRAAISAFELAMNVLELQNTDLLVLDEILRAVSDGLVEESNVVRLLGVKGKTHIVMTGHECPEALVKKIDLLTEMKKIKHPYDMGKLAVRGLDY